MLKLAEGLKNAAELIGLVRKENPLKDIETGQFSSPHPDHTERNEDAVLVSDGVYAVFDGLGGLSNGSEASQAAKEAFLYYKKTHLKKGLNLEQTKTVLIEAIQYAHETVKVLGQEFKDGMGSTCVVAYVFTDNDGSQKFIVLHVGDSRAYGLRNETYMSLTLDDCDSWPERKTGEDEKEYRQKLLALQEKIDEAEHPLLDLTEAEYKVYWESNTVSQNLGLNWAIEVNVAVYSFEPGDLFLLCSDGLNGNLTKSKVKRFLLDNKETMEAQLLADELGTLAYKYSLTPNDDKASPDDISVIVIKNKKEKHE